MSDESDGCPDSGPFCRHWSDIDCEETCARCSHRCWAHNDGCSEEGCDCVAWVERVEPAAAAKSQ